MRRTDPRRHRNRRPAWSRAVAAAMAMVTVGALATACGIPTDASPHPIPSNQVPFGLLKTPPPTTTTTVPAVSVPATVYLVAPDQHVTPVRRDLAVPATLTQVLDALLEGPTAAESAAGIQSFLSGQGIRVSATLSGGVATVNFDTNPVQVVGPAQVLAVAQVVFTATAQAGVTGVVFRIGGAPIQVPNGLGGLVNGPVGRADYAPEAPAGG